MAGPEPDPRPIVTLAYHEIYEVHQLGVIDEAKLEINIQATVSSFLLPRYLSNRNKCLLSKGQ